MGIGWTLGTGSWVHHSSFGIARKREMRDQKNSSEESVGN
jgi:hypothetical protein